MTFLNPLVLIGLAAASIPLILHLLNLRKPRTIEFSTLTFLKELQRTSIRRLKLRQILLLILRTALIVFIVLAFARPVLRGSILGSIGTHAHTSVILLLDDTFSMSTSDELGNLFRQTKEKANQLLNLLKEGDEVGLLRFSDLPDATMERMTHDFPELKSIVQESQGTAASGSLDESLRLSAKLLATSHNANKEIYILSDMQRTLVDYKSTPSLPSTQEHLFPPETKFFLLQFGSRDMDNAAVDSVSITTRIFEMEKPVNIAARIRNYGKTPLRDYVVSAYVDGQRVAQRNLDVSPWSTAVADFTIIPKRSGFLSGYIAIEEDALEHDNKRWFTFFVPEKINVVFVSPSREDVRFVSLPLTTSSGESKSTLFQVQYIPPQQFPLLDITEIDVLIISNAPGFSVNDAERIKAFVEQGGGVMIFPGDAINEVNYNTTLLPSLNIPPFEGKSESSVNLSDAGLPAKPAAGGAGLMFQNIDTDHPIFHGMFEQGEKRRQPSIESPQVFIAVKRQTGKQGRTIISLSDQTPFLSEYRIGDGVVLLFSSAPVLTWTDFPVKGLFAPLIHRTTLYTASRSESAFGGLNALVGNAPTIKLNRSKKLLTRSPARRDQFTLISPNGEQPARPARRDGEILQHHVQSTPVGSSITFSLKKVTEPGIYEILGDQQVITRLSVNVSPRESDLRKTSSDELEIFFSTLGVDKSQLVYVTPDQKLDVIVMQSRYGVELWKFFLIAALVVACVEMAVARDSGYPPKVRKDSPKESLRTFGESSEGVHSDVRTFLRKKKASVQTEASSR